MQEYRKGTYNHDWDFTRKGKGGEDTRRKVVEVDKTLKFRKDVKKENQWRESSCEEMRRFYTWKYMHNKVEKLSYLN